MASVNRVTLIGNLGADPEVRFTAGGQAVASLRMATTETWNDKEGVKQERTEWHSVTVWGKTAEHCGQYLQKGRSVYIEGRLQSREYTDKESVTKKVWEIQADKVVFLGDGGGQKGSGGGGGSGGHGGGGGDRGGSGGGGQGGGSGGNRGGSGGGGGGQNRGQSGGGGQGGGGGQQGGGGGRSFDDDPIPF